MARTNYVKFFRGQRKCQYTPEGTYAICGQPKAVHNDPVILTGEINHPFTQTPLRCEACGKPINIGDSYKWVAPRAHRAARGHKRNRHTTCPGWKASELTSSPHLASIYAAQETAETDLAGIDVSTPEDTTAAVERLCEIAEAFADGIMEASESYGESATNIEDGFGHETYQSEELREKSEAIEGWAEEASQYDPDEFDEELVCAECGLDEESCQDQQDDDDAHDYDEDPSPLDDWLQDQIDNLTDIIYNSPL